MSTDAAWLVGQWQLDRRVVDRTQSLTGRVTGILRVSPADVDRAELAWHEEGAFAWTSSQGANGAESRGYRTASITRDLLLSPSADGWRVRFSDGSAFHPWRPGEVVEHLCGADRYQGLIRADDDRTRFRTLWDVTGPAKRQRLFTRLRRIG